jgi:ABC-type multidrug transport system permease subunit
MSQTNPAEGLGIGSGIWMLATTIIAVFIGSYFAGRCSPVLGWLHGLLAWAVMVLFVAYGMASFVGGAVHLAGSIASTGATVGAVSSQAQTEGSSMANSVKQQIQGAVGAATSAASNPQAQQDARQAADMAARAAARATWISFAALVIGAIIALIAGTLGYRHQPPIEDRSGVAPDDAVLDSTGERRTRPAH